MRLNGAGTGTGVLSVWLLGVAALHMVPSLWLNYDDFSNLETYRVVPWLEIASHGQYNRFPAFGLLIYPMLLALPAWVAHVVVGVAHVAAADQLRRVLVRTQVDERGATLGAMLYVVAPAALEPVFWLAASTLIFGALALLAGTHLILRRRLVVGMLLVFTSTLFSEGLLIPAGGAVLLAARASGQKWLKSLGASAGVAGLYLAFQFLRWLIAPAGFRPQYTVGFERVGQNLIELALMMFGSASSADAAWYWRFAAPPASVTQHLPRGWIVLGVAVAAALVALTYRRAPPTPGPGARTARIVGACLGMMVASFLIYLPIVGNAMQSRYAFPASGFFIATLAVMIGMTRGRARWVVEAAATCVLGVALFNTWSVGWHNWQRAARLQRQILQDARWAANEAGVTKVLLVNDPKAVGVAYAFARDWAYSAAARQLISPSFSLLSEPVWRPELTAQGARFSETPCVFLSWSSDGPQWAQALVVKDDLWMDCTMGLVVRDSLSGGGAPPPRVLVRNDALPAIITLGRVLRESP